MEPLDEVIASKVSCPQDTREPPTLERPVGNVRIGYAYAGIQPQVQRGRLRNLVCLDARTYHEVDRSRT